MQSEASTDDTEKKSFLTKAMQYANVILLANPSNEPIKKHHAEVKVKYENVFGRATTSSSTSPKAGMEMYVKAALLVLTICYFLNKYGVFDSIKNQIM